MIRDYVITCLNYKYYVYIIVENVYIPRRVESEFDFSISRRVISDVQNIRVENNRVVVSQKLETI